MSIAAVIALNRFGLGARPGDIAQVTADPRGWLADQIRRSVPLPEVMRELPDSNSARALYRTIRMERKNAKQNNTSIESDGMRKLAVSEVGARLEAAITTELPLYERLAIFWANHFTVSARKGPSAPMVGSYEREAIRPHVFGTFRDLVRAAALHPAMLLYLDNQASIGPNSAAVLRAAQSGDGGVEMGKARALTGLNENLAREIMELHTLGVNGGYTQADVTNFAKVLTDWSVRPPEANAAATFFPERHESGDRVHPGKAVCRCRAASGACRSRLPGDASGDGAPCRHKTGPPFHLGPATRNGRRRAGQRVFENGRGSGAGHPHPDRPGRAVAASLYQVQAPG